MPGEGRILGAVLAGGASRRFGSDKAQALIDGRPMLDHVLDALRPQVDAVVVCGRQWRGEVMLDDLRSERIGPLAGLEAALDHAARHGFAAVLTVPVDSLPLPADLLDRLQGSRPATFEHQYLIGYWPTSCRAALNAYLSSNRRDMTGWIRAAEAKAVREPNWIYNINYPEDAAELQFLAMA